MYLVFLDGSGNTGLNLSHPTSTVYLLMALAVPGRTARRLEDAMTAVLERRFGAASRAPGFECKGSDLYRGDGPCAALPPADRVAIYAELVGLLATHGAELIWVGIDKPRLAPATPPRCTRTSSPSSTWPRRWSGSSAAGASSGSSCRTRRRRWSSS